MKNLLTWYKILFKSELWKYFYTVISPENFDTIYIKLFENKENEIIFFICKVEKIIFLSVHPTIVGHLLSTVLNLIKLKSITNKYDYRSELLFIVSAFQEIQTIVLKRNALILDLKKKKLIKYKYTLFTYNLTKNIKETQINTRFKDIQTYKHQSTVSILVDYLSKKMILPKIEIDALLHFSIFHDYGKQDENILKIAQLKRKINEEEFQIIKTHPIVGFESLLDKLGEEILPAAFLALGHHFRYDNYQKQNFKGSSYPTINIISKSKYFTLLQDNIKNFTTSLRDVNNDNLIEDEYAIRYSKIEDDELKINKKNIRLNLLLSLVSLCDSWDAMNPKERVYQNNKSFFEKIKDISIHIFTKYHPYTTSFFIRLIYEIEQKHKGFKNKHLEKIVDVYSLLSIYMHTRINLKKYIYAYIDSNNYNPDNLVYEISKLFNDIECKINDFRSLKYFNHNFKILKKITNKWLKEFKTKYKIKVKLDQKDWAYTPEINTNETKMWEIMGRVMFKSSLKKPKPSTDLSIDDVIFITPPEDTKISNFELYSEEYINRIQRTFLGNIFLKSFKGIFNLISFFKVILNIQDRCGFPKEIPLTRKSVKKRKK